MEDKEEEKVDEGEVKEIQIIHDKDSILNPFSGDIPFEFSTQLLRFKAEDKLEKPAWVIEEIIKSLEEAKKAGPV